MDIKLSVIGENLDLKRTEQGQFNVLFFSGGQLKRCSLAS